MTGILATIILSLTTPVSMAPVVVTSCQCAKGHKTTRIEPAESNNAFTEFMNALAEGKLTKPGRIVESVGRSQQ